MQLDIGAAEAAAAVASNLAAGNSDTAAYVKETGRHAIVYAMAKLLDLGTN